MGAEASLVGVDSWVRREWIGEDIGCGKALVHPLAAVLDGHDTADDFAVDCGREDLGLLSGSNVLAVGGIVVGHRPIQ